MSATQNHPTSRLQSAPSSWDESSNKKIRYAQGYILPKANRMLTEASMAPTIKTNRSIQLNGRSLIVALRASPTFNPAELSSDTLFSHQRGFKYRYTRNSTLAQRRSMDEPLDTYIRDWSKTSAWYGRYEVLTHPDDPERPGIIHGIWDLGSERR
ncbi:uncharacterized protein Z518_09145 [Rhinocladiella mackenziei CBS 650.93]|uniref:Uncharacterized protein n=1 Tax=Rhinocladiella mackenziei CBS 650.93 TaxID=1442369 RepID=A0A0D2I6I7_9EURO|nr:uncharacterized protein Z518_09145 [Rhinocladiella mackenziei CBS 650.93]KIX01419.1 hypothetical protein Z518_09145 [Rhinocladiella mackenziei CBS 650.93]